MGEGKERKGEWEENRRRVRGQQKKIRRKQWEETMTRAGGEGRTAGGDQ